MHLPSTLDGSWTLACVFVIAVFFTVGGVYWERRESGPEAVSGANEESTLSLSPSSYGPTHFLALTVQAALQFTAIYFDYLAVTYAHVGDAVAIYSLSALWTPILESITSRKWPHNQVRENGDEVRYRRLPSFNRPKKNGNLTSRDRSFYHILSTTTPPPLPPPPTVRKHRCFYLNLFSHISFDNISY